MNTDNHWVVMVEYRRGPAQIYGGVTYDTLADAQEVADELITNEFQVTNSWPEFVKGLATR